MSDTNFETVVYATNNAVATITINRPDAMNSTNRQLRSDLLAALKVASSDDSVRVILLAANGRAFCAGQDLNEGADQGEGTKRLLDEEYKPLMLALDNSEKVVIAAVNGACAGVGTAIALASDLVVMADDAYMYQAFIAIGLIPDGGACWQLVQKLGYRKALEIAIEGKKIPATECLALGLTNRVVAADRLLAETQAWAEQLAEKAPLAIAATKKALKQSQALNLADTISMEAVIQAELTDTEDAQEAIKAFLDKRKPVFKGK